MQKQEPLLDAVGMAVDWAETDTVVVQVPNSRCVVDHPWLEMTSQIEIVCASAKSKYPSRPSGGVVIAFDLPVAGILDIESVAGVDAIVAVRAHGPTDWGTDADHSPWITAFDVQHLGGDVITPVPDASAPIQSTVRGLTRPLHSLNTRERHEAVQALTYLRSNGVALETNSVMAEALRNGWLGSSLELRQIAIALNGGTNLRYESRLRPEMLREWLSAV
ncbi:hypothetical protein [Gordonia sp. NPDC003422]